MNRTEESSSPIREAERTLLAAFLAVRTLALTIGGAIIASSWRQFQHPNAALGSYLFVLIESAWLATRTIPRGSFADPLGAWVDAVAGAAALAGFGYALFRWQLLGSLDWAISLAYGVALGSAVAHRRLIPGVLTTTALAAVTLASRQGTPGLTSAILYFAGFFSVARYVQKKAREWARRQDRQQTLRREAEQTLAAEQERNRQHRLIHDTVLQTVEAIGTGLVSLEEAQALCRGEAARLRRALQGLGPYPMGDLLGSMSALVDEFAPAGLRVEFTSDGSLGDLPEDRLAALVFASREALTNVRRHARVGSAVMNATEGEDGCQVVIRDQGRGFDTSVRRESFGLSNSILGRISEVGGRAEVWSELGRGTRVTLWVPK
jgi:signal transduction histidine kinase